jgi:squalene-hopene/tetraprenyl-beta-curcumene cyclase
MPDGDARQRSCQTPSPPAQDQDARQAPASALDLDALDRTVAATRQRLLDERNQAGHWRGELSPSALSTATALAALAAKDPVGNAGAVQAGLEWLAENANDDGGWGDTPVSASNLSTTLLVYSAGAIAARSGPEPAFCRSAARWIERSAGGLDPARIARAVLDAYAEDRTFSAPILAMCALAGRLGEGRDAWRDVPALPFEAALLPHAFYRFVRLPVVSYALPALIAVGQLRHHHRPTPWPIARQVRDLARGPTLGKLATLQPDNGGFLEAAPLTAFVLLSLAGIEHADHLVARRAEAFLRASQRSDGSWPIDTDLATWVSTLSIKALIGPKGEARPPAKAPTPPPGQARPLDAPALLDWLIAQQHRRVHPYTQAAPGGWAWTDLPGAVPDADDTPGALLAIARLAGDRPGPRALESARAGIGWLMGIQNADGGIPTFCRGWGRLPFDRSAPDLTAHAFSALGAWAPLLAGDETRRIDRARGRMLDYLADVQGPDGTWGALWFGNERAPGQANPTYGTARVILALCDADAPGEIGLHLPDCVEAGVDRLLGAQRPDGGWGGDRDVPPSIEETALAVDALSAWMIAAGEAGASRSAAPGVDPGPDDARRADGRLARAGQAIDRGASWLVHATDEGRRFDPAPIGLYFARLWYHERLYPVAFALSALTRARASRRARR